MNISIQGLLDAELIYILIPTLAHNMHSKKS